jgi:hypothetical protein
MPISSAWFATDVAYHFDDVRGGKQRRRNSVGCNSEAYCTGMAAEYAIPPNVKPFGGFPS